MKRSELANLLGISRGMVSRLESRGMPVHSLEAAAAWRQANLDPGRRKPLGGSNPPRTQPRDDAAPEVLARVERAHAHLAESLRESDSIRMPLRAELRSAMRAVPREARASVWLQLGCWRELIGSYPSPADPEDLDSPFDDSRPWYEIACGEVPA